MVKPGQSALLIRFLEVQDVGCQAERLLSMKPLMKPLIVAFPSVANFADKSSSILSAEHDAEVAIVDIPGAEVANPEVISRTRILNSHNVF